MTAWTDTRISRLTTLWRKGRSASQIASDLGPDISRSAVLGKVRRLNLHRHEETTPSEATSMPAAPQPPSDLPAPGRIGAGLTDAAAAAGAATILTVRRGDCRWPLGDPASAGFCLCGAPVSRGVYCATHAAVAYAAQPLRLEALLRLAGAS